MCSDTFGFSRLTTTGINDCYSAEDQINKFPIITKYDSQYSTHLHDKIRSNIQHSALREYCQCVVSDTDLKVPKPAIPMPALEVP